MYKTKIRHNVIGLGGTFDHFHQGHKDFIEFAQKHARKLVIGITHNNLTLHKPYAEVIQPFHVRLKAVVQFCKKIQTSVEIIELHDLYGTTLTDTRISALAVTSETLAGGSKINEARHAASIYELPIFICPMTKDELGFELHSENIRAGKINRDGIYYRSPGQSFVITNTAKAQLKKPLGKLLTDFPENSINKSKIIVVGDVSLDTFLIQNRPYDLGIFDGQSQRQPYKSPALSQLKVTKVENNPSTLSAELLDQLENFFDQENQQHIKIVGEEDLAVLGCILTAPLSTKIYYGQPNEGIVEVIVTEELKTKIYTLLS